MKIIAISASQVPSSAANSIQALKAVHALAQAGHEVRLLVPQSSQEASPTKVNLSSFYGLEKTFPVEFLPAASRRLFFWRAVQSARAQKPDVLYVWPPQSAVYGLMAGLPVLLEMHDLPSGLFGPLWYRAFLALPGKKRQAVITRSLQNLLQNRFGAAETVLAPNGVDLERFAHQPDSASARHLLNLPQTQTAACVGHLYPGRGVEMFLALAGKMQPVHFLWVGGNAEEVEMWRAKAAQMNLSNVTFTGFIHNSQIPLYQAAADVLLMPYSREIGISSGGGNSGQVSSRRELFEWLILEM